MFNKNTIEDIEKIEILISNINKRIKSDKQLFLTWTFPINHLHAQQSESENYFVVWGGCTDKELKMISFGPLSTLIKLISDFTEADIINSLKWDVDNSVMPYDKKLNKVYGDYFN